jgi:hypothetical protein
MALGATTGAAVWAAAKLLAKAKINTAGAARAPAATL